MAGAEPLSGGGLNMAQPLARAGRRCDLGLNVTPTVSDEGGDQRLHRAPRHQSADARLDQTGLDTPAIDPRTTPAKPIVVEHPGRTPPPGVPRHSGPAKLPARRKRKTR